MAFVDLEVIDDSIQDRLRALVTAAKKVESADDAEGAIEAASTVNVPALLTYYEKLTSEGRVTYNTRGQVIDIRYVVMVVTQSFRSKAASREGATGAYKIIAATVDALREFKPVGAMKPLVFVDVELFARTRARVAYAVEFRTSAFAP